MEILMEILFELYLNLMLLVVPEEKATSQRYRTAAILVATVVLLGSFVLFVWGSELIATYNNTLGAIPITISVLVSLAQIVAGIVLYNKRSKK